ALDRDALDLLEEVEEPVAAMEFAVGADLEPRRLLQRYRVADRRGLDLPPFLLRHVLGPRVMDLGRTEPATHHVRFERRLRRCHRFLPSYPRPARVSGWIRPGRP